MSIVDGGRGRADFGGYKVELEDGMDRPHIKNCLKKLIYTALSEHTGRQLPWGTLTGIRPTKIPMTMMEEDVSDEEIMQYMQIRTSSVRRRESLPLKLPAGKRLCLIPFIMKTDTVFTLGFRSARPLVCTVPLPLIRSFPGKRGYRST